jgi:hypothetical protein
MTDGRWILEELLRNTMRNMPGMSRTLHDRTPHANEEREPGLRATTEMILAMPIDERLREIETEADFLSSSRPVDD